MLGKQLIFVIQNAIQNKVVEKKKLAVKRKVEAKNVARRNKLVKIDNLIKNLFINCISKQSNGVW